MLSRNYVKISNKLRIAAKKAAERSMETVASKLRGEASTADVGVSVDGTWQGLCFHEWHYYSHFNDGAIRLMTY